MRRSHAMMHTMMRMYMYMCPFVLAAPSCD